jgi:hypothetical protein
LIFRSMHGGRGGGRWGLFECFLSSRATINTAYKLNWKWIFVFQMALHYLAHHLFSFANLFQKCNKPIIIPLWFNVQLAPIFWCQLCSLLLQRSSLIVFQIKSAFISSRPIFFLLSFEQVLFRMLNLKPILIIVVALSCALGEFASVGHFRANRIPGPFSAEIQSHLGNR